jgi:F-type H+-transporting ATPase subunit delta
MKTVKQMEREARRLFRLCLVNGAVDETRARVVVDDVIAAQRLDRLPILSRFHRRLRLDRTQHLAEIESAVPLPSAVRDSIEVGLAGIYGRGIALNFTENPALIAGVRITVGSDVYDGSVRGRLAALEAKL